MSQMQRSEIKLSNGNKFVIIHNLPNLGLDINTTLDNWLGSTNKFTSENFCDYIMSKDPINILAFTEERFKQLSA